MLRAPDFSEGSEERRVVNMGDVLPVRQLTHGAPEPLHINLVNSEVVGKMMSAESNVEVKEAVELT